MSRAEQADDPGPDESVAADRGAAGDPHAVTRDAIRRHIALSFLDGRVERLGAETPLVSSGIIDSAGVLHLVDWLEQRFALRIEDEDVVPENFDSLDALARLVAARSA